MVPVALRGGESDEIFDQTQKPNKGPSIRRDEHHIGHTGGYKEIKKLQQTSRRNQNSGTVNLFVGEECMNGVTRKSS